MAGWVSMQPAVMLGPLPSVSTKAEHNSSLSPSHSQQLKLLGGPASCLLQYSRGRHDNIHSINLKHMCKDNSIICTMNLISSFTPSHSAHTSHSTSPLPSPLSLSLSPLPLPSPLSPLPLPLSLPSLTSQKELTEYYYYWKKTNAGLTSRNTRRQRKQSHIRMSKAIFKPQEVTPEREFCK